MKKLIIVGSALAAFSAISFLNSESFNSPSQRLAALTTANYDTVPKKSDSTHRRDSVAFVYNATAFDTVPKKSDTSRRNDSVYFVYNKINIDTVPKKDTGSTRRDSLNMTLLAKN